jgi:hypothetical protein
MNLVPLQSKFSRQIFLLNYGKGNFGGKNLLFKRVNLLCKEGFFIQYHEFYFTKKNQPNGPN